MHVSLHWSELYISASLWRCDASRVLCVSCLTPRPDILTSFFRICLATIALTPRERVGNDDFQALQFCTNSFCCFIVSFAIFRGRGEEFCRARDCGVNASRADAPSTCLTMATVPARPPHLFAAHRLLGPISSNLSHAFFLLTDPWPDCHLVASSSISVGHPRLAYDSRRELRPARDLINRAE